MYPQLLQPKKKSLYQEYTSHLRVEGSWWSWLTLTVSLTNKKLGFFKKGVSVEELPQPDWPVGLSVGDCLDC